MRDEVLRAALSVTARLVFPAIALSGCNAKEAPPKTPAGGTEPPSPSASASNSTATEKPEFDCTALLDKTFTTPDKYPGENKGVAPEVQRCCEKALLASEGMTKHRWNCCANLDKHSKPNVGIACTPWGPPMPPPMPVA